VLNLIRGCGGAGLVLAAMFLSGLTGCNSGTLPASASRSAIVGTWMVRDPNAPFPWHMYVFNADGTMQQANPDAGDPHTSDSDGKGIWVADAQTVRGKWVEFTADRATHAFLGRLEIVYEIRVTADRFTGTESARVFDAAGRPGAAPPTPAQLEGQRITLP
jgi:hypothetical protein